MSKSNLDEILIRDEDNQAFKYLIDNYSLNIKPFSRIADLLIEVAIVSALELSECNSKHTNKRIVHFFFMTYI